MTAVLENTPPYYSHQTGLMTIGDYYSDLVKMKKQRSSRSLTATSELCTGGMPSPLPNVMQTIKNMSNNNNRTIDNRNANSNKLFSNYNKNNKTNNNNNNSENYNVYDSDNNNDSDNDNNDNDNDNANDNDNNNDHDDYDDNNSDGNNNNNNNNNDNNANGNNSNNNDNGNGKDGNDPNRKDNRNKKGSDRDDDNSTDDDNDEDDDDDDEKKSKINDEDNLKGPPISENNNKGEHDKENYRVGGDKENESDTENDKPDIDNDNNNNKRPLSTSFSSSSSRSWSPSSNSNRNNIFICNQISLLESNFIDSSKKRRKQLTPIRISSSQKNQQNQPVSEEIDECSKSSQDKGFASKLIMTLSVEYDGDDRVTLNYDVKDKLKSIEGCQQQNRSVENNEAISCGDDELEEGEISNKNLIAQEMNIKNDVKDVNLNKEMWSRDSVENIEKDENNLNALTVDEIKAKSKEWLTGFSGLPFAFQRDSQQPMTALDLIPQLAMPNVQQMNQAVALENLRTNGPPFRIFNPEAYCDICNKEFCNKYFLKTHKANKHGIYEPQSTTDMPSASAATNNQSIQIEPVFHINSAVQQPQLSNSERTPPNSTTFPSNGLEIVLQNNNIQNQTAELAAQSPNSNFPSEISLFCDLCFKRFTNIFTMRRHRLNCTEVLNNEANQVESNSGGTGPMKTDSTDGNDENRLSPFKLPECFREDFSVEQEDATFTPEPRKLSPSLCQQAKEANFAYDKLKRLGVINPEAFCELCCKEYCNKYFLRTHKLKRHGILIPMDDEIPLSASKYQSSWHYVQTSPLNLMTSTAQSASKSFNRNFNENLPMKTNNNNSIAPVTPENPQQKGDKTNDKVVSKVEKEDFVSSLLLEIQLKTERKSPIQDDESENSNARKTPNYQPQDTDAVSVDLQKLQSMILQLNNLNAPDITGCNICGKEIENRYALHAHMISEHSNLNMNPDEMADTKKFSSPCRTPTMGYTETCKYCDKDFTSISSLKQHLYEEHGYQLESPMREGFRTPENSITNISPSPSQNERNNIRPAYTITPTSSYCELCNKELCNKYFMKTHMQRMHGIEIENGAQIGGVVCNICNKELCSKYFLRVHKHNTHGVVDEGSPLPQPRQNSNEASDIDMKLCNSIESNHIQYNSNNSSEMDRYFTHYTEVCPICTRRFKNAKWLQSHLASDHGRFGLEKLNEIEVKLENDLTNGNSELINENNNSSENSKSDILMKTPTHHQDVKNIRTAETPPIGVQSIGLVQQQQQIGGGGGGPNKNALSDIQEYYCSYCQFSTPYLTILFIHEKDHTKQLFSQKQRDESKNGAAAVSRIEEQLQQYHKLSSQLLSASGNSNENSLAVSQMKQAAMYLPDAKLDPKLIGDINNINNNILSEVASIVQCPALYALPQKSWPMIMQSFLVEENLKVATAEEKFAASRFVPSFIYFPVKERISNPITVSFTLTPT